MVIITIRKIWIRRLTFSGLGVGLMYVGGLFFVLLYEVKDFAFCFDNLSSFVPFMMFIVMFIVMMGLFAGSVWCFFLVLFEESPSVLLKKYIDIKIKIED